MSKILIIEDEELVREGIVLILTINGFTVFQAENGKIGVQTALKEIPDLIISDIMMPELDGYEVLKAIRANEATSTIPILFLSAKADQSDIRHGMNLGADDYLTKPFQLEELLQAVKVRLERSTTEKAKTQEKIDTLRTNLSFALPHELLTPLIGILGLSKILGESWSEFTQDDAVQMLNEIHQSGQRLHRLIQNFLLFSRLEMLQRDPVALKQFAAASSYSAADIIEATSRTVADRFNRNKDLVLEIVDAPIKIASEHFAKIVEELTDNACKFSENNSTILLRANVVNDTQYSVIVEDKGRGMTDDEIRQIGGYMQFGRQEHEQQGAGLGLAISKKITEFCHGNLTVESTPEVGTKCILTLMLDMSLYE